MAMIKSIDDVPTCLLTGFECDVSGDWIDYNGHMNVAYYVLAFDLATDHLGRALGIGETYMKERNCSYFALDLNVTYRQEVKAGSRLRFATQLLDVGPKKLLFYHYMFAGEDGYLAASCENLSIHVDMTERRSAPFPEDKALELRALCARHATAGRPDNAGRILKI